MAESGINVTVNDFVLSTSPLCEHGPTLLFERKNGKFYACSACRDRKDCPFFMWEEAHKGRKCLTSSLSRHVKPDETDVQSSNNRLKDIVRLPTSERRFCRYCWLLLLPSEWREHDGHLGMDSPLKLQSLRRPTSLLAPLDNNKKEAQYFFSKRTTEFFISTVKSTMFTHVLCIGCPRIHEHIGCDRKNIKSFLLDIDDRFRQFYPTSQFARYNMFNHHFFDMEATQEGYRKFLRGSVSVLIIIDPPFGGLVEPLAHTIATICREFQACRQDASNECVMPRLMWLFPYFMEKKIVTTVPDVTMLDYKVDYENHSTFKVKKGDGLRAKSPIRIFTNISPATVVLPQSEGYRFCEACRRYVAAENSHCLDCNSCTSKDGRTYRHCNDCGICVKPNYVHCDDCKHCHLPDVECFQGGCFTCGDKSHKRRACPREHQKRRKRRKK